MGGVGGWVGGEHVTTVSNSNAFAELRWVLTKVCTSGSFRKNIEHPLCIGINDIGMINS